MSGKVLLDTNAIIYALNDGLTLPYADYLVNGLTLISNDKQLSKIDDLDILSLEEFL